MDRLIFEATGKPTTAYSAGKKGVGAWTDGIGIYADNDELCAMRLVPGARYRVTVERIEVNEDR